MEAKVELSKEQEETLTKKVIKDLESKYSHGVIKGIVMADWGTYAILNLAHNALAERNKELNTSDYDNLTSTDRMGLAIHDILRDYNR